MTPKLKTACASRIMDSVATTDPRRQRQDNASMTTAIEKQHPIVISQVMINFAASKGLDRDQCLKDTGISPDMLADSQSYINRSQEMQLIANIQQALGQKASAGFELGLQYNLATFGVWGFTMRSAKTLRQAVDIALRYIPLSTAYCDIQAIEHGDEFIIRHDASDICESLQDFILLRDMASAVNLIKEISYSGITLSGIQFSKADIIDAELVRELCGIEPELNAQYDQIVLRTADADRLLPSYDPQLFELLEAQCKSRLERLEPTGLSAKVRELLIGPMGLSCALEDVANALAMSPRTLRRKLDAEGVGFRDIVDEERRQRAEFLLSHSSLKIEAIALELGFTDAGGFSRAFKRWKDCTPGEYRNAAKR